MPLMLLIIWWLVVFPFARLINWSGLLFAVALSRVVYCGNSASSNGRSCTLPLRPICTRHSLHGRWCRPVVVKEEQDLIGFMSSSCFGRNASKNLQLVDDCFALPGLR